MLVQQQQEDLFLVAAMPSCTSSSPGQLNPHSRWNAPLCQEYNLYDVYVHVKWDDLIISNDCITIVHLLFIRFIFPMIRTFHHMIGVQRKTLAKCVLIDISCDVILSGLLTYTCMAFFLPTKLFCGIYRLSAENMKQIHLLWLVISCAMIFQIRDNVNVIKKGKYAGFVTYWNVIRKNEQIGLIVKVAIPPFPIRNSEQKARTNNDLLYMLVYARIIPNGLLFACQLTGKERETSFSIWYKIDSLIEGGFQ